MQHDTPFTHAIHGLGSVKKLKQGKYAQLEKPRQRVTARNADEDADQKHRQNPAPGDSDRIRLTAFAPFLPYRDYLPVMPEASIQWSCPSASARLVELKRGRLAAEHSIDLHGCTLVQAADQLRQFLGSCHSRGVRVVRVIHGKGSRENPSSIKSHIPIWCKDHPLIMAYASASPSLGGTGAVLLLLRRRG